MSLKDDYGQQTSTVNFGNIFSLATPSANTTSDGTGNTSVSVVVPTVTNYYLSPGKVFASYNSVTPTTGVLSVTDTAGTSTYFAIDISADGAAPFDLDHILLPISTGMKITLAAGGTGVKSKLNAYPHKVKA